MQSWVTETHGTDREGRSESLRVQYRENGAPLRAEKGRFQKGNKGG
uniref:Uncharacterized protein n=1 Tax=Siphoviridae sp. ctquf9 TaxID=2826470 RepID=A0A8S5M491_9CAUD|nr:MAG TPA: hypothetical protein [Siphoviridae sp. ctquf9]